MARQRLQQVFHGRTPALLLERSIGARAGVDADLWGALPFAGQVTPDLPVASSWAGLLQAALRRFESFGGAAAQRQHAPGQAQPADAHAAEAAASGDDRPWTIRTVAAQVRSQRAIEDRMRRLTDHAQTSADEPAADALLCLSGSHPVRRLPGSDRWLLNSFQVLRTATRLRSEGQVPGGTSIWAVENPLTGDASRLAQKVDAGAEVIVTQPPLVWGKFEDWFDQVHSMGLAKEARLVVGLPLLTSPGNLAFWAALCDCRAVPGYDAVMADFRRAEAAGPPALRRFCRDWNADLLRKVQQLPDVSGVHVMPLTKAARGLAKDLLA